MGKLNDSLLSGSYGRTGRLVVANVSGTEILRVRPRKRSTPPTAKQLLIQNRMKSAYGFIESYKAYASQYFGVKVGMRSCYNLAITNIINAMKLDYVLLTITIQYNEIMFSLGPLLNAMPTGLTSPTAGTFTLQWFNNAAGDAVRETDLLQVVYIAEDEAKSSFLSNVAQRQDETFQAALPPSLSGKKVHVWMAFKAADSSAASSSAYVGSIVIS